MASGGETLQSIAKALMAPRKGILAADESSGTIKKRFDPILLESTEESRRAYRDLLFATPGSEAFISGVILYDETIRQKSSDGTPFPQFLASRGVIPGIKVDMGAKPQPGFPKEQITEGLDGLRERLQAYYKLGARFAKWRAVIDIAEGIPTEANLKANAFLLAQYAMYCQETGIVPIIEPEVLMDGAHDINTCYRVTLRTLRVVFRELEDAGVVLDGILLKPNMVIDGAKCPTKASADQIAELTIKCFLETVPAKVPGIVFLSGGQSEEQATLNLSRMNQLGPLPWPLGFSYGRALQASTLKAWQGKPENVPRAQQVYLHRCRMNGLARTGEYTPDTEKELGA